METLDSLARSLAAGAVSSTDLVAECLDRIADPAGEGSRSFTQVFADEARAAAARIDALRAAGAAPSRYAGIPISVKDLFDIAGSVTCAGSRALAARPPATADAPAVERLRRAGFVVIGRTNMTEFAYSGLGLNPHYDTPKGIWDRQTGHIPGGSSSGAAVSVADGMAHAALGTDTGGSCRIPAAFNRLTGYKPTASRVPQGGLVPLSSTLDSVGSLARSTACCAALDAILSGEPPHDLTASVPRLRLALPRTFVLDGMDPTVAARLDQACATLRAAGAVIDEIDLPELAEIPAINAMGGFAAFESYAWHRELLATSGHLYDPRIRQRIEAGAGQDAADYRALKAARRSFIDRVTARLLAHDGLIFPTTPITPPQLSVFESDDAYLRLNGLCLRNPAVINLLDGCSISLPIGKPDGPPVGLMISGLHGQDRRVFAMAAAIEATLAPV